MSTAKTQQPILTTSIPATADLAHKHRFVNFSGGYCTSGEIALGTLEAETANGDQAPVNVLGIVLVEAGGPVARATGVVPDDQGRAVEAPAAIDEGVSLDEALAAGDLIRIVRGI